MKTYKYLLLIMIFFTMAFRSVYSDILRPKLITWECPSGSREKFGWKVLEDTDSNGVYDTEKVKLCNGLIDRHPIPGYIGGSKEIGEVPDYYDPAIPQFIDNELNWVVIQKDSSTQDELYRVVHEYSNDTTFIISYIENTSAVLISYLEGEHRDVLKNLLIKPNPISNYFEIIFDNSANYLVKFQFVNTEGKVFFNDEMHVHEGLENKIKIDINSYPNGIYFIKFDSEGLTETKKLVISK